MQTNYERIKSMTVEEMAGFLDVFTINSCDFCCNQWSIGCYHECELKIKQWLESEVKK